MHPSKHASVSLCVHIYVCVCDMCLHAPVHNIMCSAQPEAAAVLDWYSPEADPAYWQRGREEVAGLQVACEAHNVHVGGNTAPKSLVYKLYRSCTLSCILVDTLVDELLQ